LKVGGSAFADDSSGEDSQLTNSDRLDADALFDVGIGSIVGILALQNLLAAESVDKSCAT